MDIVVAGLIVVLIGVIVIKRDRPIVTDKLVKEATKEIIIKYGELQEKREYTSNEKDCSRAITDEILKMINTNEWKNMSKEEKEVWNTNLNKRMCKKYKIEDIK